MLNRHILLALLNVFVILSYAQEKRIALVIGNANYSKAPLKNPVNDALLMQKTLKDLGFKVILDTNILTRQGFIKSIGNYQKERELADIGFVYYAGHGIQIDGKNYMLPTQERYESKFDVIGNGVDVELLMNNFLVPTHNEVNIFVFDACRNNPFESNWNATRSIGNSSGLATVKATGALVAYSTEAGITASDGNLNETNSIYTKCLAKQLSQENIRIDRVFLNVRSEVRLLSNNQQFPSFYNQLEGEDLILKPSQYLSAINDIDSLIDIKEFDFALKEVNLLLAKTPNLVDGLLRKGQILYNTMNDEYNGTDLIKASELNPKNPMVYCFLARYYSVIFRNDQAIISINQAIELSPDNDEYHYWKGLILLEDLNDTIAAKKEFETAVNLNSDNVGSIFYIGIIHEEFFRDYKSALNCYTKSIEIDNSFIPAITYKSFLLAFKNNFRAGVEEFKKYIETDSLNAGLWKKLGVLYEYYGDTINAIKCYNQGLILAKNRSEKSEISSFIADLYQDSINYNLALEFYNEAINLNPNDPNLYMRRGWHYYNYYQDESNTLINYTKAIEVGKGMKVKLELFENRGDYYFEIEDYDHALFDYLQCLKLDSSHVNSINSIGLIYEIKGEIEKAESFYKQGMNFILNDPIGVSYILRNLADIRLKQNDLKAAENYWEECIRINPKNEFYILYADFLKNIPNRNTEIIKNYSIAIENDPNNIEYLLDRALFYSEINEIDKSQKDYERILKIKPDDGAALNNLGLIFSEQNNNEKAIELYTTGIKMNLDNEYLTGLCYSNRAEVFFKLNEIDKAISDMDSSLISDPLNPERYYNAFLFYYSNNLDVINAINTISIATYLAPENLDYINARACFYRDFYNDMNMAAKDFERILEIDSNNINTQLELANLLYMNGDYDGAKNLLVKILSNNKSDSLELTESHLFLAQLYQKSNNYNSAQEEYYLAEKLFPKWDRSELIDFYLYYIGDSNKALSILNSQLENERNDELLLKRIEIEFSKENYDQCVQDLNILLDSKKDEQNTLAKLAVVYSKLGNFKKATNLITLAINLDTTNHDILFYQLKIHLNQGNVKEALQLCEIISQLSPFDPEVCYQRAKIYTLMNDSINMSIYYSELNGMLKNKGEFIVTNEIGNPIEDAPIFLEIGKYFEQIDQNQQAKRVYEYALNLLRDDYRIKSLELKTFLTQRLKYLD